MGKQTDWEELFKRYKASGLNQAAFCKANNIPKNQFHYRWYECNKGLNVQAVDSEFEPVSLGSITATAPMLPAYELVIYLANEIRCEVKMDINGLTLVLIAMVKRC